VVEDVLFAQLSQDAIPLISGRWIVFADEADEAFRAGFAFYAEWRNRVSWQQSEC
jgi:hypothetical protein